MNQEESRRFKEWINANDIASTLAAEAQALMNIESDFLQCPICLIEDPVSQLTETPCAHFFHPTCMRRWRTSHQQGANTCPACRQALPGLQ